jgi:molecular chaperone GrpE
VEKLREGTELTLKMLGDVMGRFGVEQLDPLDQPFDPEYHQAMSMQPRSDVPPNTVVAVVQKGYRLNGRLVRPAMVMVSQAAGD